MFKTAICRWARYRKDTDAQQVSHVSGHGMCAVLDRYQVGSGHELLVRTAAGEYLSIDEWQAGWYDPCEGLTQEQIDSTWPPITQDHESDSTVALEARTVASRVDADRTQADLPASLIAQWALVRWHDERRPSGTAIAQLAHHTENK